MKNLHLLPTEKPSILGRFIDTNNLFLRASNDIPRGENVNIYITSDEEIKDVRPHKGKWHIEKENILNKFPDYLTDLSECKLVIMTTDDDLINDGVQEIDDEFLQWFVKNPSCEEVVVEKKMLCNYCGGENCDNLRCRGYIDSVWYEIIIPKEEPKQDRTCTNNCSVVCGECQILEPKQETLEEAVKREYDARKFNSDYPFNPQSFILGAKWQQEQNKNLYSEEDLLKFGAFVRIEDKKEKRLFLIQDYFKKWLEQSKRKITFAHYE